MALNPRPEAGQRVSELEQPLELGAFLRCTEARVVQVLLPPGNVETCGLKLRPRTG